MESRIQTTIKRVLREQGRTQAWTIQKMNAVNPEIRMDRTKFSAITRGRRKMTGDELLAFCKATEVNPDIFVEPEQEKEVG